MPKVSPGDSSDSSADFPTPPPPRHSTAGKASAPSGEQNSSLGQHYRPYYTPRRSLNDRVKGDFGAAAALNHRVNEQPRSETRGSQRYTPTPDWSWHESSFWQKISGCCENFCDSYCTCCQMNDDFIYKNLPDGNNQRIDKFSQFGCFDRLWGRGTTSRRNVICAGTSAVVCLFLMLIGVFITPHIIFRQLMLLEGLETYDAYVNPPLTTRMSIYFFNITNNGSNTTNQKQFEQVGPLVFNLERKRENVRIDGDKITSQTRDTIYLDPLNSKISLEDNITTVNLQYVSALIYGPNKNVIESLNLSQLLFFPNFGFLKGLNDTLQPPLTVYNGAGPQGRSRIYEIVDFDGLTRLPESSNGYSDECAQISGRFEGVGLPPMLKKNPQIYFSMLNRTFNLVGDGYKYGQQRYIYSKDSFDGKSSENQCFNQDSEYKYNGMIFLPPDKGAKVPVTVSFPHFLHADESEILNKVNNMTPDAKLHTPYIVVEPATGLPREVSLKSQINVLINDQIIPLIWTEAYVKLPPKLTAPLDVVHFVLIYLPVIELICTIILTALFVLRVIDYRQKYHVEYVQIEDQMPLK